MRLPGVLTIALAMLLWLPPAAQAQDLGEDFTNIEPKVIMASGSLRDPEFRVESRKLGFRRDVEMLQWAREEGQYVKRWSDSALNDEGFDPAHRNPGMPSLKSELWLSREATIDGKPVEPSVLMALGTWIRVRPNFSRVPYRWSRRFEPDGDGMSNSDNPLEPTVGDVRITWSEMFVPTLERQVVFANGIWQLPENLKLDYATREELVKQTERAQARHSLTEFLFRFWGFAAAALVLFLVGLRGVLNFRARRRADG